MSERITVVVASSDEATRTRVKLALGDERFEVEDAADTDAAVLALATRLPRLLVLDSDLPGSGALALARTARAQPETAATRTLLLVHRGEPAPEEADGVDAVVSIPASPFALLRKIDGLLGSEDA